MCCVAITNWAVDLMSVFYTNVDWGFSKNLEILNNKVILSFVLIFTLLVVGFFVGEVVWWGVVEVSGGMKRLFIILSNTMCQCLFFRGFVHGLLATAMLRVIYGLVEWAMGYFTWFILGNMLRFIIYAILEYVVVVLGGQLIIHIDRNNKPGPSKRGLSSGDWNGSGDDSLDSDGEGGAPVVFSPEEEASINREAADVQDIYERAFLAGVEGGGRRGDAAGESNTYHMFLAAAVATVVIRVLGIWVVHRASRGNQ